MRPLLFLALLLPTMTWANEAACIKATAHAEYAIANQTVKLSDIDWQKAISLCEAAIEEGSDNYKVYYGIGRAYAKKRKENENSHDFNQTVKYYGKSFDAGFPQGAWAVAMNYIEQENWPMAELWLEKGIQANSIDALNQKSVLYIDKKYNYPHKDVDKAIALLKQAEHTEHQFIHYNLGRIYYYTDFERKDLSLAMKHFKIASKSGNAYASYLVGRMYDNGWGVTKDADKAIEYYVSAKELGEINNKDLDEALAQNAWRLWVNDSDNDSFEYYDIAINTLRELAKNGNNDAIKFLYRYQVGISAKVTPMDFAIVNMQSQAYIKRATKAAEESQKNLTKANVSKTRNAIKKYADLMIDNGLYQDVITYFEATAENQYSVTAELNGYYLALSYLRLYSDYRHESDAIKAIANAKSTGDESIINMVISTITLKGNKDLDINTLIAKASLQSENRKADTFFESFNTTVKVGASDRAMSYVDNAPVEINAQRSNDGASMLHIAVWYGDLALTKKLVKKGANINLKDAEGDTPLAYAIHNKDLELITFLSANGGKN